MICQWSHQILWTLLQKVWNLARMMYLNNLNLIHWYTTAKVICYVNLLLFLLWKQYLEPFQRVCVKPTDLGTHTNFAKNFAKELNSVRVFLLRRFAKFVQSILHSWNPLIWQVGSISAYSLQHDFGSNISNTKFPNKHGNSVKNSISSFYELAL